MNSDGMAPSQLKKPQPKNVVCPFCSRSYPYNIDKVLASEAEGIWDIGLKCPHCGKRVHSHLETDELRAESERLRLANMDFTTRWNELQLRRAEFGAIAPSELEKQIGKKALRRRRAPKPKPKRKRK